jgi:polyribonucleotide nucleotidyltransferase
MFAEALHSMIMGIQLALEVKTSIGSSTIATCSSTESSSQKPGVPINSHHRHRGK